jgi:hypothetical protein
MQSWIKKHLIRKEHNDAVRRDYSSSLPPPRLSIARDGSGGLFIRHTGVPDVNYRLQRAVSLAGPWSNIATNTATASGLIEFHETAPPPTRAFYRTVQPRVNQAKARVGSHPSPFVRNK